MGDLQSLSDEVVAFARSEFNYPDVVVAVGRLDGEDSRVDTIGMPGAPDVDGDTLFEIGSLTKPITALALASMVRTREVTLDMPIGELFPQDVKAPQKDGRQITLLDLATHRSGLPRLPPNIGWSALISDDPYKSYNRAKLFSYLDGLRLRHLPGESFEYSNLGYGLLGTLLADRADVSYAQLVDERVFAPLAMLSSRADYRDDFRLIQGHSAAGKPAPPWHAGILHGAGAVRSTIDDMLRFVSVHLAAAPEPLASDARVAQEPRSNAEGQRIGLAWLTSPRGYVWHNGGTGGYRSFMGFSPLRGQGVVVLANAALGAVDTIGAHLLDPRVPLRT
jgi:CubicO group peptidase (beta-lactamase class C family)